MSKKAIKDRETKSQILSALAEETGLPVFVADDPLTCVARGGGIAMTWMDNRDIELLSS